MSVNPPVVPFSPTGRYETLSSCPAFFFRRRVLPPPGKSTDNAPPARASSPSRPRLRLEGAVAISPKPCPNPLGLRNAAACDHPLAFAHSSSAGRSGNLFRYAEKNLLQKKSTSDYTNVFSQKRRGARAGAPRPQTPARTGIVAPGGASKALEAARRKAEARAHTTPLRRRRMRE